VTLADTGIDSMTGGRIARVDKYIDGDTFLMTYGDGVSDVNVAELVEFHKSHGRIATVTTVSPTSRFGMVDIAAGDRVGAFNEKPKTDGWMSAGYSCWIVACSITSKATTARSSASLWSSWRATEN